MTEWVVETMGRGGHLMVAVLMFLENLFPPIPSEVIMPLAGFSARRGELTLWGVILAGTLGSVIGQLPLYYLGYAVSESRLKRWADRWGRWVGVRADDIDRAMRWFDRRGAWAVLICRFLPGLRSVISVPAGMCRMHLLKFLALSATGMGLWAAALAAAGWWLGEEWSRVQRVMGPVSWGVLSLVAIAVVAWVLDRRRMTRP